MVSQFLKSHVILQPLSSESIINASFEQVENYNLEQQIRIRLIEQMEAYNATE